MKPKKNFEIVKQNTNCSGKYPIGVECSVVRNCKEKGFLNVKAGDRVFIMHKEEETYKCRFNGFIGLLPWNCFRETIVFKDCNKEDCLKVVKGDIVLVLEEDGDKYVCWHKGKKGLVPKDLLTGIDEIKTQKRGYFCVNLAVVGVFVVVVYVISPWLYMCLITIKNIFASQDTYPTMKHDSITLITTVSEEFNNQQADLWTNVHVCLERLQNERKLCVLLFLHREDAKTFLNLIERLVSITEKILKKTNSIYINGNDIRSILASNESFLTHYKHQLEGGSVMVIKYLESIPSNILRSLHSLCDEDNPAVENAAIFLMLLSDNLQSAGNIKTKAEMTIKNKWSDLPDNILDPLTARLTVSVSELVLPTN